MPISPNTIPIAPTASAVFEPEWPWPRSAEPGALSSDAGSPGRDDGAAEEALAHPYFGEFDHNGQGYEAFHDVDEPELDYNDDHEALENVNSALDWQQITIDISNTYTTSKKL